MVNRLETLSLRSVDGVRTHCPEDFMIKGEVVQVRVLDVVSLKRKEREKIILK